MEVHISSAGAEQVLVSQAVTVRRPRVLYVAGGKETSAAAARYTLKRADVDLEMVTVVSCESSGCKGLGCRVAG